MTRALFSDARAALRFALNHEDLSIPGPVMNKEMAAIPDPGAHGGTGILKQQVARSSRTPSSVPLGGMSDRTVMAGWILQKLESLAYIDKTVLKAVLINPRRICSCGAACCRGWSVKTEWVNSVRGICEHLKTEAEITRVAGKRGLSTDPRLRSALVEDYCRVEKHRASITELCKITEAATVTVAKHRELIHAALSEIEVRAWGDITAIFDATGITGDLAADPPAE